MKYTNYYWLLTKIFNTKITSKIQYDFDKFDLDDFCEFIEKVSIDEVNNKTNYYTYKGDTRLSYITYLIHSQCN